MKLEIYCAMCGKETVIEINKRGLDPKITLRKLIQDINWIVEINGAHFDIYCSKKCAK